MEHMDTVIQEHDKNKWLVLGNLEIHITSELKKDFKTLRGVLKSKKSAVDIIREMRDDDRVQEKRG
jgi:hypothetical protein